MSATAVTLIGGDGYNRGAIFTTTAAPTAQNDSANKHSVGDVIIDTTNHVTYRCVDNTATAAKWVVDGVLGQAQSVAISAAAGAASSNICNVTFQVTDVVGNSIAGVFEMIVFLSDAATGAGLTATSASGTVVGTTGADFGDLTAKKAKVVQTDATGKYVLAITDTLKTHFYPCAEVPGRGTTVVGTQLLTANYG